MSEADPSEVSVVVTQDGFSVEKSYEPDDFPVPAIAFVIRSERDELVEVRLSDRVPEEVDPSDIGFHPKYGAEYWEVEDGRIVFEREFEAGEEYTTVYGLRSETEDIERYLTEPEFESIDPPLEDAGEVVREVMDENADATSLELNEPDEEEPGPGGASPDDIEGALAEAESAADEGSEETDEGEEDEIELNLSGADEADSPDAGDDATSDTDTRPSRGGISPANVAEALAAELREGNVSPDAMATLRAQLEPEHGSVDARIGDLQNDVADLRAYTGALEEFLDEEGSGQEILDDLQAQVAGVEASLDDLEDRASRNSDRIGEVDADLASLDEEVLDVSENLSEVESTVSELESQVQSVDDRMATLSEDIESVQEEVGADIDDRVGDLETRLDDIQGDLDQLDQMRKQLSSVFGAQSPGDEGGPDDES